MPVNPRGYDEEKKSLADEQTVLGRVVRIEGGTEPFDDTLHFRVTLRADDGRTVTFEVEPENVPRMGEYIGYVRQG